MKENQPKFELRGEAKTRMNSSVLAGALLVASPGFVGEANPAKVSEIAGAFAGVVSIWPAIPVKPSSSLLASYNSKKKETIAEEKNERCIESASFLPLTR
jgi:hypothetical protein